MRFRITLYNFIARRFRVWCFEKKLIRYASLSLHLSPSLSISLLSLSPSLHLPPSLYLIQNSPYHSLSFTISLFFSLFLLLSLLLSLSSSRSPSIALSFSPSLIFTLFHNFTPQSFLLLSDRGVTSLLFFLFLPFHLLELCIESFHIVSSYRYK